ncbi:MAG: hypothetical protein ACRD06_07205 [Terriglobia bacterium]
MPFDVFRGRHLLAAKLRRSTIGAIHGAIEGIARIVVQVRPRSRMCAFRGPQTPPSPVRRR